MYRLARAGFGMPGQIDIAEALYYIHEWIDERDSRIDVLKELGI